MRRIFMRIAIAVFLSIAPFCSYAGMSPFGPSGMPLTKNDLAAMSAAADPLLKDDSTPLGTSRDWNNTNSGNRGSIKLIDRFQYKYQGTELPCRKLAYTVLVKNVSDPYKININWCKVADGSWKFL